MTATELNEKLTNRKVYKGRDGWQAKTKVKDVKGYDWEISTYKSGTALVSIAQSGRFIIEQGYDVFNFQIVGDPRFRLREVRERCTEKTISDSHTKALKAFVDKLELSTFKPTYN